MHPILVTGIIILTGFIFGEIAKKFKLPKITGYILAGIAINPNLTKLIPKEMLGQTDIVLKISLSFITFSVGGNLLYSKIKKLGKGILSITFFEASFAYWIVFIGFLIIAPLFIKTKGSSFISTFIPLSLLIAALASPTDPSATLAISHEYKAKGEVTSTIMGVAAFDDIFGIISYSFSVALAMVLILNQKLSVGSSVVKPIITIFLSIGLGALMGFIFNQITIFIRMHREKEGTILVAIFGILTLCCGISQVLKLDELLASIAMGAIVVNFNVVSGKIFKMLEQNTEELLLVLFFTLSGMRLNFSCLSGVYGLILIFFLLRAVGKYLGTYIGATVSKSSKKIKKFTVGGLIPQGGIVIGLALLISQNPAFSSIGDTVLSVIIGATILHELVGPVIAKMTLKGAKEIKS